MLLEKCATHSILKRKCFLRNFASRKIGRSRQLTRNLQIINEDESNPTRELQEAETDVGEKLSTKNRNSDCCRLCTLRAIQ
jgi:hypothetical protein